MTSRASAKNQSNLLLNLFVKCYEERYKRKPTVNRFRERWGFQDMIDSVGFEESENIIRFYFEIPAADHTCRHLFYNFDTMQTNMQLRAKDRAERAALREQTRERMEGK
jgi:hypothetical protein